MIQRRAHAVRQESLPWTFAESLSYPSEDSRGIDEPARRYHYLFTSTSTHHVVNRVCRKVSQYQLKTWRTTTDNLVFVFIILANERGNMINDQLFDVIIGSCTQQSSIPNLSPGSWQENSCCRRIATTREDHAVEWFDCHAEIGRRAVPGPLQAPNAAALAALYGEIGISARWLSIRRCMRSTRRPATRGSRRRRRNILNLRRPGRCCRRRRGVGRHRTLPSGMRNAGVRALWAFPTGYAINAFTFGSIYEEMVARHIPLFLKMNAIGWDGLATLLHAVRGLKVVAVLTNCWGEDRYFRPLIEKYPGLHLCTSLYMLEGRDQSVRRPLRAISTALRYQLSRLSTRRQPLFAAACRPSR